MSRVGNKLIVIPPGVDLKIDGLLVTVKGPRGTLSCTIPGTVGFTREDNVLHFTRSGNRPQERANHGLARALVANLVTGVTDGFRKNLEINGTGYKWEVRGKDVVLAVGYSHPVVIPIPDGIKVTINGSRCEVDGSDKQQVGFIAAQIRRARPVEPYKGKGIHYTGEYIRRKAGKAGA